MKIKTIVAFALIPLALIAGRALGAETGEADPGIDSNVLATAAVPFITFAVKLLVDRAIPDAVIVRLRDEWLPFLVPIIGVVLKSVQDGQLDLTQGVLVGLAGIGLHQLGKATGLIQKTGAILRRE